MPPSWPLGIGSSLGMFCRTAIKCTATISRAATSSPGIQHHRSRRRNDRPDGGRRYYHGAGEPGRIARLLQHRLDGHQAGAGGVGDGAAAHARKNHADQYVHLRQAAAHAPHQHACKVEQPVADGAGVHKVGGKDEQRHRQQHITVVHAVEDLLRRQPQVLPLGEQVGDARAHHRKRDRRAQQQPRHHHRYQRHEGGAHNSASQLTPIKRTRLTICRTTTMTRNTRNGKYTTR